MAWASAHIGGIPTVPPGGDVCSQDGVLCCFSGEETGFFGHMEYPTHTPVSLSRVVPITECSIALGQVIISFAGQRATQNLSDLPAPPVMVAKLDLSSCTGLILLRARIMTD